MRRKDQRDGSVAIADVAHTWYRAPQNLPPDVDKGGLEVTAGYRPDPDTGTHSYACHACVVRVDTETGAVVLEDYLVVEDGGKLVNPMIVDGQVLGGLAQGIGTALYEEMPYDEQGQPLAATLADYLLPGTTDVPDVRLDHMETLSPWTTFGQKGIGESGAIGPPGAIVNAINDALAPLGAEVLDLPASPPRVLAAIAPREPARRMKPAPFAYARPKDWSEALKLSRRGRAAGRRHAVARTVAQPAPGAARHHRRPAPSAGLRRRRWPRATCCASAPARRMPRSRMARCRGASARSWPPSRAASPIARCATAARSAAAWRMPTRRPTGSPCCRRSVPRRSRSGPRASVASPRRASSPASSRPRSPPTSFCAPSRCRVLPAEARWGHWKFCRKVGEFSKATACVLALPGQPPRAVLAALDGPPLVIEDASALVARSAGRSNPHRGRIARPRPWRRALAETALRRAVGMANAP